MSTPTVWADRPQSLHKYKFPCDVLALILFWEDRQECPGFMVHPPLGEMTAGDVVHALRMEVYEDKYAYLYHPETRHFKQAYTIRNYYRTRHAHEVLMGKDLSDFEIKLSALLDSDPTIVDPARLGIYASILKMYNEDLEIDMAVETFADAECVTNKQLAQMHSYSLQLKLVRKTRRSFGECKKYDYWFKGSDNFLYRTLVPAQNHGESYYLDKILHMSDNLITLQHPIVSPSKLLKRNFTCIMLKGPLKIC